MTSRLERLISLLSTGSTPLIRETAAVQLGSLGGKEFPSHSIGSPEVKEEKPETKNEQDLGTQVEVQLQDGEDPYYAVIRLTSRIVPLVAPVSSSSSSNPNNSNNQPTTTTSVSSSSTTSIPLTPAQIQSNLAASKIETRIASVRALKEIWGGVPVWTPSPSSGLNNVKEEGEAEKEEGSGVKREDGLDTTGDTDTDVDLDAEMDIETLVRTSRGVTKPSTSVVQEESNPVSTSNNDFLKGLNVTEDLVREMQDESSPAPSPKLSKRGSGLAAASTVGGTASGSGAGKKIKKEKGASRLNTPSSSAPTPPPPQSNSSASALEKQEIRDEDIFAPLSSRQVLLLKRKIRGGLSRADALAESKRLQGVATPTTEGADPIATMAAPGPGPGPGLEEENKRKGRKRGKEEDEVGGMGKKIKLEVKEEIGEEIGTPVITAPLPTSVEPVSSTAGGNVQAVNSEWEDLIPSTSSEWVWTKTLDRFLGMIRSEQWESRHGGSLAIRDLVLTQGKHAGERSGGSDRDNERRRRRTLRAVGRELILVLVSDRFGDYVGDTVVAPVREAASQALATTCRYLSMEDRRKVLHALLQMILQPWLGAGKGRGYVWELRHAGLLGLRYLLVVMEDLGEDLHSVLQATMVGLSDTDDDVRSVSATCLLPILPVLSDRLSQEELVSLLDTLWNCFSEDGDELGSSTSAVMDLLCKVLSFDKVISLYSGKVEKERSLSRLIPRLYPYFRHAISPVRLAVVRTLRSFFNDPELASEWMNADILHLLYRNLVLEERPDIRGETMLAWNSALHVIRARPGFLATDVLPYVAGWLNICLTPISMPLEPHLFHQVVSRSSASTHDVDKSILRADFALVSPETILRNRVDAIIALAEITRYDTTAATHQTLVGGYLSSTSGHQLSLSAILMEEWTRVRDEEFSEDRHIPLHTALPSTQPLVELLWKPLESGPPAELYEVQASLQAMRREMEMVSSTVARLGKRPKIQTPIDIDDDLKAATAEELQTFVDLTIERSIQKLSLVKRAEAYSLTRDRRDAVSLALQRHKEQKEQLSNQIKATAAAALIGVRFVPPRLNPLVGSIMQGVKSESNQMMQNRAANSVANFIANCLDPRVGLPAGPAYKLVNNLANFICEDEDYTPKFNPSATVQGVITLQAKAVQPTQNAEAHALTRRGSEAALSAIVNRLGTALFEQLPNLWDLMAQPILLECEPGADNRDDKQNYIDALTVLQIVLPLVPKSLHLLMAQLIPGIVAGARSVFAVIRNAAGKALAVTCQVMPQPGMQAVLQDLLPVLGDSRELKHRQGAIESIWSVVDAMQFDILPYVLFMIVPVLGRMSDPDEEVRLLATQTFATLVKLVPLEAGIPEPPGISKDMLAKRELERDFLSQLLDNKKVQPYELDVPIEAELRPYQQDGINWMAFLAKYQLHGCLCDDMGLGKSLQSICMIASKHEERRKRFADTRSPDAAHIPSIIVCPTTLIGHWYHEITKFTSNLRPFKYYGSTTERQTLRRSIPNYDVIVTSYEIIRSDIDSLQRQPFFYCILDEGHMIKNSKSKLTLSVKSLQATHRLILSGTPIQNNVLELWSLFDFLMPGFLGTEKEFNDKFAKPILANKDAKATAKQKEGAILALEALHKQVLPFVLRRMKEDVLHDLPPKIIQDYYCDLSKVQQSLYEDFQASKASEDAVKVLASESDKEDANMDNAVAPTPNKHIFQTLQYLRKLCNHPMLAMGSDLERYKDVVRRVASGDKDVPKDPFDIAHSPKLLALQQLLQDCGIGEVKTEESDVIASATQHRVLIFCQTRQMLDIIQTHLFNKYMPSVTFMRLDGGTEAMKRHDIVQTFNADPSIDVLLLTTSVGGLGLTLTGADTVIFIDHDWNPTKDMQAMDRAHRLGQKKVVNVYRLITRGTLEEKIMSLQRFKQNMANTVITHQNQDLGTMNTDQVLDLFSGPTAAPSASKPVKDGPMSKNDVLAGLEDLPAEEEYQDLTLDAFMSKF